MSSRDAYVTGFRALFALFTSWRRDTRKTPSALHDDVCADEKRWKGCSPAGMAWREGEKLDTGIYVYRISRVSSHVFLLMTCRYGY